MRGKEIQRAVKRGRRVIFTQLLHAVAEVLRAAAQQISHQRRAEGVVHQPVRLAAQKVFAALRIGDLRRAVLPDLAKEVGIWILRIHYRADPGNELIGQLVGDVQPPAGSACAQPALDDGVVALDDVVNIALFQLVDGGQVLDAPPGVVIRGEGVEAVPAVVGRSLALRRTEIGIKAVSVEVDALAPGVVEHTVKHDTDAALLRLCAKRAEVLLIAEQRVDAFIAGRVVAVVGGGLKDRAEIKRRHAKRGQIVQLFRNALQVAAEKVAAGDLALRIGAVLRQLVPARVQRARADHACNIARLCAAKPVGKDLIGHAAAEPLRRLVRVVINRELPGGDRVPGAETVLAIAAGAAVRPGQAEVIPDQRGAAGRGISAAENRAPVLLRGGKLRLRPAVGKFLVRQQLAAHDLRAALRLEAERDGRSAGDCAKGGLVQKIARIEPRS